MKNTIYFKAFSNDVMDVIYFNEDYIDNTFHTGEIDSLPSDYIEDLKLKYDLLLMIDYQTTSFKKRKVHKEKEPVESKVKGVETILLENNMMLTDATDKWVSKIDSGYEMINSAIDNYHRSKDYFLINLLTNPDLKRVCTSSAFMFNMDVNANESFGKNLDDRFTQLDYYAHMLYYAIRIRNMNKCGGLELHINYHSNDFLEKVNSCYLGNDVNKYLKLMFRQFENEIVMSIYNDYKLVSKVRTEDDLNFK